MTEIYNILILKILNEIIPATKISITKGNKIFGAAILKKNDLSTVHLDPKKINHDGINFVSHAHIDHLPKNHSNILFQTFSKIRKVHAKYSNFIFILLDLILKYF